MFPSRRKPLLFLCFALTVFFLEAAPTQAHAILLESSPALNSSVSGPDHSLKLRFNVRIDSARSRLTLVRPDGSSQSLAIEKQSPPDTISSQAKGMLPGAYRLRWQVLASDGHITRGEIPFTVTNS